MENITTQKLNKELWAYKEAERKYYSTQPVSFDLLLRKGNLIKNYIIAPDCKVLE